MIWDLLFWKIFFFLLIFVIVEKFVWLSIFLFLFFFIDLVISWFSQINGQSVKIIILRELMVKLESCFQLFVLRVLGIIFERIRIVRVMVVFMKVFIENGSLKLLSIIFWLLYILFVCEFMLIVLMVWVMVLRVRMVDKGWLMFFLKFFSNCLVLVFCLQVIFIKEGVMFSNIVFYMEYRKEKRIDIEKNSSSIYRIQIIWLKISKYFFDKQKWVIFFQKQFIF